MLSMPIEGNAKALRVLVGFQYYLDFANKIVE